MGTSEGMARREPEPTSAHRGSRSQARVAIVAAPPVRRAPVLEVGAVHDAAEHEADRLAESVVARLNAQEAARPDETGADVHSHGAPGAVRRTAAPTVGREGGPASAELSDQIESMRGGGSALDTDVRRRMGGAFGTDFSRVRVHTDEHAAQAASAMGALAFTTGDDIFFGAGQYRPDDAGGQHVLAHELAHTVQQRGGARRKVSRLWDLRTNEGSDLTQAARIRVLKERLVLFMEDDSGDTMVVKLEKEPIGLGALAGEMHKKLTGAETVQYRKLPRRDRGTLKAMLGVQNLLDTASWTGRGNHKLVADNWKHITDPVERAVTSVTDEMDAFQGSELLAMSVAPGEGANQAAARPDDDARSLKTLLDRPKHVRELGKLTAVDLLLGNKDRVHAGNLGNWFYDPAGALVVLDNVDGAGTQGHDAKSGVVQTTHLLMLAKSELATTAAGGIDGLRAGMKLIDPTAGAWFDATLPGGRVRSAVMEAEFLEGLKEGKKYIAKVFSSTRWTTGGKKSRAIKKGIKQDAQAASALDAGANGAPSYYETLKARAAWLAKN
ncbi:hypothetical protein BH11ACT1_BH11ACT1_16940 [soil metagenome]